jgi:trehalose 6-phosphate synthase/phosphatase
VVWFQDYHLALAPALVRARRPDLSLAHFWHIPWPPLEIFEVTPQAGPDRRALANDLLGFQLPSHRSNFLRCAEALLDRPKWTGTARPRWTATPATCGASPSPSTSTGSWPMRRVRTGAEEAVARLRERYCPPGGQLAIGVDRMDYSKGLPEKLKAFDFLWERYPEFRGTLTLVQVGVPSRTDIEAYDELTQKVERLVWEINDRYGTTDWQPVHLIKQSLPADRLAVLYRAADVCVVASLRDGMNLVAKEFVVSPGGRAWRAAPVEVRRCGRGAGRGAQVNPYDPEDFSRLVRDALMLPPEEKAERIRAMRGISAASTLDGRHLR